jgi:hypothetical protein
LEFATIWNRCEKTAGNLAPSWPDNLSKPFEGDHAMPVGRAGSTPPPITTTSASSSTPTTTTPASGSSIGSTITNILTSDTFVEGAGKVLANAITGGGGDTERPEWAQAPREPGGEGMFKNKTEDEIYRMSPDELAKATPREIYSMTAFQVSAFEKAMSGGPAVYDKYQKGSGENNKLSPEEEKRMSAETEKAYNENMPKLGKEQQRAFTYAKLHQGIFKDMMAIMQKHSKIAG